MNLRRLAAIALLALAGSLLAAGPAPALSLDQIGTFAKPINVTSPPGDPERIFVVEREGTIELVEEGTSDTYVDLTAEVACCEGERGLSSLAFDPDFATNRKLYVAYTTAEDTAELNPGDIVVEELTAPDESAEPPGPFVLRTVLVVPHDQFNIHNGGQLQFGPDGMLYLSTGDGGLFDPRKHPQETESGLGKILRFDPAESGGGLGYTAPADNPFAGGSGFAPIVWAQGLRNPFRFSFDRLAGDLVIADVGEGAREEIDWAPSPGAGQAGGKGANYGWACVEGSLPGLGFGSALDLCAGKSAADFDPPAFEYDHVVPEPAKGVVCSGSVIGGYVVRDPSLGGLAGRYVYADYCTGEIRALRLPATAGGLASEDCSLGLPQDRWNSFGEDAAGRLYVASSKGGVYRFAGPLETCLPDPVEPDEASSPPISSPAEPPPAPKLALRISARRSAGAGKALLSVTVAPCAGQEARTVQLRRNGEPNGAKRVGADCEVHFKRRLSGRVGFRARLLPLPGGDALVSRRLVLGPQ